MSNLIRLLVAGLIAYASWRAGNAYYRHYQFADEVQHIAQFGSGRSDADLQSLVMETAGKLGVPVRPENIVITREETHTKIDAVYTDRIEIVPTWFYPWEFKVSADALTLQIAPVR